LKEKKKKRNEVKPEDLYIEQRFEEPEEKTQIIEFKLKE
jgi:hypothetical protein